MITSEHPRVPEVRALLEAHLAFARAVTPPEHVHAVGIDGLLDPAITVFSARRDGELIAVGALKWLDEGHVEVKSMHTATQARGTGVGRALLDHLVATAAERDVRRISLETGTMDAFAPARTLYTAAGFVPCDPFGEHTRHPGSICMTLELDRSGR